MAKPLCQYFGKCGGCSLQHIDYLLQLENKKKVLANAVNFNDVKVFSGEEYYYRNRMDFIFHSKGLGFREKDRGKGIVDVEQCVIANESLNSLLTELRNFFKENDFFNAAKGTGTFRYAVIRTPENDSSISFALNSDSKRLEGAIEKIKEFSKITKSKNVIITYVPSNADASISDDFFAVKGSDVLKERYLGKEIVYSAQGFFQNNPKMAEKMHEYCYEILKSYDTREAHLLDIYAGVGCFGIINAGLFKMVTIIESVEQCIKSAKINIEKNNIKNAEAILLDAKQLKKVELAKNLFVVTDPPRSGMHPTAIEQLKKLRPKVIIYVSCNMEQLRKDIPKFKEYKVKSAALFDFFPQTNHSEAVVELVRDKK